MQEMYSDFFEAMCVIVEMRGADCLVKEPAQTLGIFADITQNLKKEYRMLKIFYEYNSQKYFVDKENIFAGDIGGAVRNLQENAFMDEKSAKYVVDIFVSALKGEKVEVEEKKSDDFEILDGVLKKYRGNSKMVVIPHGITEIGDMAFLLRKEMECVEIPSGVRTIGDFAFAECEKLESIEIPSGVRIIGQRAFFRCKKLKSIEIPETVREIKDGAFSNCKNLESIVIYSGTSMSTEGTLAGCDKLKDIYFKRADGECGNLKEIWEEKYGMVEAWQEEGVTVHFDDESNNDNDNDDDWDWYDEEDDEEVTIEDIQADFDYLFGKK